MCGALSPIPQNECQQVKQPQGLFHHGTYLLEDDAITREFGTTSRIQVSTDPRSYTTFEFQQGACVLGGDESTRS